MARLISTLAVGAKVKSLDTKYNNTPIIFVVGHKPTGRVKLVSERIISLKCFDAREPSNPNLDRQQYGNNRYAHSNIDQWLNKADASWYVAQHAHDAPPTSENVWDNHNPYDTEQGFLANFEQAFRDAILNTDIIVARNTDTDGGGSETITRKVYLLSNTEVGLTNENSIAEGSKWDLFSDDNSRKAYPTAEAVSMSEYTNLNLNASSPWYWWLRTPRASISYNARGVNTNGTLDNSNAYRGHWGVRPALDLASEILVSDNPDTDGAYIIQWNQPPSAPSFISYGTPHAGQTLALTCGASIDPDGDSVSYVWEHRTDSGTYTQIGTTSATTINATVPTSGTNYQARVKAVDSKGAESAYTTGSAKAINYNSDPTISGADQDIGSQPNPVVYNYTVDDVDAGQTLTVTEKVTNGGGANDITLRTYAATRGVQNTADLTSVWLLLLKGSHQLIITVTDGAGGMAVRTITFSRPVTRIAASRAVSTDEMVTKCMLSLFPETQPLDATVHVEVTNNPFDASPTWEDISSKVNRFVHIFENETVTEGNGIGYRFYIQPGESEETVALDAVYLRFA